MKRIKILSRRRALEKKGRELEKKQSMVKDGLKNLTKKCDHEIVLQVQPRGLSKYSCCLFCNEAYPCNTKGTLIKMDDYKFLSRESLENLYLSLREEFPEDTEAEIGKKLVKKLEEEGKRLEK